MKSIYKTVDYEFKNLPKPEEIEDEIKRQEDKGWRMMDRTDITPRRLDKRMRMTITYQETPVKTESDARQKIMDADLKSDLELYGFSWLRTSKSIDGKISKSRVHPNKVRIMQPNKPQQS